MFDVVFIGGGPGGYTAAIRAAQLGLKTACVERRPTLGGTCLNIGCIPSKALLYSSQCYEQALHRLDDHGIMISSVTLDLARMQARKAKLVEANAKGIEFLFRKNKVVHVQGTAHFIAPNSLAVTARDGREQVVESRAIVIATGSDVASLAGVTIDEKIIVSSTGALAFSKVPEHLVVVGGGVIGLELGSVWRRLGAKVTVVEFLDRLCPAMDAELTSLLHRLLARQGMAFHLESKVTGVERQGEGAVLTFEPAAGGAPTNLACDAVLIAIGRKPYTHGLGLDAVGVAVDGQGRIVTDGQFRTNIPSIFAIGDVIDGPMLAHKAEEEGVALAELLAGQAGHVNYGVIPSVIYTAPEAASVGMSEEQAKAAGIAYKVGKFPFSANGRARAMGEAEGFVKILADAGNDRVLGVHIVGPEAGVLIAEAAVAMEFAAASEDIARTCHAHPTLSEAFKEAALAVEGRSRSM